VCEECLVFSHSDIVGAARILHEQARIAVSEWVRPMARPAVRAAERARNGDDNSDSIEESFEVTYFNWNDHERAPAAEGVVETLGSFDLRSVSEPQTSSGQHTDWVAQRGISRV